MANYHKPLILKSLLLAVVLQYALPAHAQLESKNYQSQLLATGNSIKYAYNTDSLDSDNDNKSLTFSTSPAVNKAAINYDNEATHFANAEASITKPQERKELMGYLKQVTAIEDVNYNQSHTKFMYGLANVFAKLKLYPLAMKCFLKTTAIKRNKELAADTLEQFDGNNYLAINTKDDSIVEKQTLLAAKRGITIKNSKATNYNYIVNTLNDGKKAAAYAMLFHVKQPVPGKRKIFSFSNTGHTFITLIKYNTDSTYSSFSFGFYPKKRNPLSATPVVPATSSVFKDDTYHQWDEVVGKFISKRKFEKILLLTKQYDHLEYHLSNNNCTDFGLRAAQLAGINIDETTGKWPLGHGNNPAITGQSILEGKFSDADTGKDGLFVNTVAVVEQ